MPSITTKVFKVEKSFEAMYQDMLDAHQELADWCFGLLSDLKQAIDDREHVLIQEIEDELVEAKFMYDGSYVELIDVLQNHKEHVTKYTVLPHEFVMECVKYDIDRNM